MCHHLLSCATFHSRLLELDRLHAAEVRALGCPYCPGVLHVADYPRKPRGIARQLLGAGYRRRFSFCCASCRRRTTPFSLRFLGRRVYLGAVVVLLCASKGGLTTAERAEHLATVELPAQTLHRWRRWWTDTFPRTRCWRMFGECLSPKVSSEGLPGALLMALLGDVLDVRLERLLVLISPLTSRSGAPFARFAVDAQKM